MVTIHKEVCSLLSRNARHAAHYRFSKVAFRFTKAHIASTTLPSNLVTVLICGTVSDPILQNQQVPKDARLGYIKILAANVVAIRTTAL
jgi:hypothetical protein